MSAAPSRLRRILRRLGMVALGLVVIAGVVIAVILHDLDAKARAALVKEAARAEALIGRRISIGAVHVTLARSSELVVHDIVVEAAPGAPSDLATPPLRIPTARLTVTAGPIFGGKDEPIEVTRFEVDHPEITIVRTPEGLSIDDIRARLLAAPRPPPPERRVALRQLSITDAKLHLHDMGADPAGDLVIEQLSLSGTDVSADTTTRLMLSAAALGSTKNVDAELDLAPAASGRGLELARAEVHLHGVRLAPLLRSTRMAGADLALSLDATVDPAAGTVTARSFEIAAGAASAHGSFGMHDLGKAPAFEALDLDLTGDAGAIRSLIPPDRLPAGVAFRGPITASLHGSGSADDARASIKIGLADVRLSSGEHEGSAAAVTLACQLAYARAKGTLQIADASLSAGDLALKGDAEIQGSGEQLSIESLSLAASGKAEGLLDLIPPDRRPPGLALRGPLSAKLSLHGKKGDLGGVASLDLGGAQVSARGFAKPAGVPLAAAIEGRLADGRGEIAYAELRLGSLAISLQGWAKSASELDLSFAPLPGRGADIARVLSLFPAAAERVNAGAVVEGLLTAKGKVRREGARTDVEITASLGEARLRKDRAAISGAVQGKAVASFTPGAASVEASLDLGGASIDVAPILAKPRNKPLDLSFKLAREGDRVSVTGAKLAVPGLAIDDLALQSEPGKLHIGAPSAAVTMARLLDLMPLAASSVPAPLADATLHFGLEIDGAPDDLESGALRVPSFDLRGGLGHLAGSLTVEGLKKPRAARLGVQGGEIDLSGFAPLPGETARAINADLAFDKGRLEVRQLRLDALGGSVRIEKSWVDLTAGTPEVELHAQIDGLDLSRLKPARLDELGGRASISLDMHGRGQDADQIVKSLRGTAQATVRDLHVKAMVEPRITLVNPLLSEVFKKSMEKRKGKPRVVDVRKASATLDVGEHAVATRGPALLEADDFTARLSGTVGKDRSLALDGQIEIPPHVIAEASHRRLIPVRPIPLKLRIFGEVGATKAELLELGETAGALRGAVRNAVDNAAAPVP